MAIQSSDLLYSVLSIDVYERTELTDPLYSPPYPVVANETDTVTGFGAAAYQVDGKIVIAFRGADTSSVFELLKDLFYGFGTAIDSPV